MLHADLFFFFLFLLMTEGVVEDVAFHGAEGADVKFGHEVLHGDVEAAIAVETADGDWDFVRFEQAELGDLAGAVDVVVILGEFDLFVEATDLVMYVLASENTKAWGVRGSGLCNPHEIVEGLVEDVIYDLGRNWCNFAGGRAEVAFGEFSHGHLKEPWIWKDDVGIQKEYMLPLCGGGSLVTAWAWHTTIDHTSTVFLGNGSGAVRRKGVSDDDLVVRIGLGVDGTKEEG